MRTLKDYLMHYTHLKAEKASNFLIRFNKILKAANLTNTNKRKVGHRRTAGDSGTFDTHTTNFLRRPSCGWQPIRSSNVNAGF